MRAVSRNDTAPRLAFAALLRGLVLGQTAHLMAARIWLQVYGKVETWSANPNE